MLKTSFTVVLDDCIFITGVTSIVPNLNGFLFFTEDGQNHFIESCELIEEGISGIAFEYFSDEDIKDLKRFHGRNTVYDHREKR